MLNLRKVLELFSTENWVGVREISDCTHLVKNRDGNPEVNAEHYSHGLIVEVFNRGAFGYAATSDLSESGIISAYQQATRMAIQASVYNIYNFDLSVRPSESGIYRTPCDTPFSTFNRREVNDLLFNLTNTLRQSERVVSAFSIVSITERKSNFASTSGNLIEQEFIFTSTGLSATAIHDGQTQTRTDGGLLAFSYQKGLEALASEKMLERATRICEQAVELSEAEDCPSGFYPVVLAPDQMMLQIHESVGHPLEIDRILGDECNYAGWSFVKLEDFGSLQYGSELMNITFDPSISHQLASYGFDDSGARAQKEFIIKEGVLQRGLGGLESEVRSGVSGVSCFRTCSWNRAPIDRMANLNLEPGDSSITEMLSSVEKGIYMESNRSWSIDDYRRKFQFGCEYGRMIENGTLTKVVKNPNYRGISVPFWNSLKMVGNRDTFEVYGTPYCGKGEPNQCISVGHASPVCLFENVDVFGGA